jgi:hypothetical protein
MKTPIVKFTLATVIVGGSAGFLTTISAHQHVPEPETSSVGPQSLFGMIPRQVSGIAGIHVIGDPILVFDHRTDKRDPLHLPDIAPTAWKEADGTVNVLVSHFENYRMRGPDLEHLTSFPNIIYDSQSQSQDLVESHYNYHHWLAAPYTFDGRTIYALAHSEWYACLSVGDCATTTTPTNTSSGSYQLNSWANTINAMVSSDGGATWNLNGVDADHVVADESFHWTNSAALAATVYRRALDHTGLMQPSRILAEAGYFYSIAFLVHRDFSRLDPATGQAPTDKYDWVLMRTRDLTRAAGWEAWVAGSSFTPLNTHAFTAFSPRKNGASVNAAPPQIIYDANTRTYILIFVPYDWRQTNGGPIYYITTPSLANPSWSEVASIDGTAALNINPRGGTPQTACAAGFEDANYVSIIDSHSDGLSFEKTDGDPWLFYVFNPATTCGGSNLDRDVYRLRLAIDYR